MEFFLRLEMAEESLLIGYADDVAACWMHCWPGGKQTGHICAPVMRVDYFSYPTVRYFGLEFDLKMSFPEQITVTTDKATVRVSALDRQTSGGLSAGEQETSSQECTMLLVRRCIISALHKCRDKEFYGGHLPTILPQSRL